MRPDTTSRTEAEAGAYEAVRGATEWIGNEPSRAELEADTAGSEPGPDPWLPWTCPRCGFDDRSGAPEICTSCGWRNWGLS